MTEKTNNKNHIISLKEAIALTDDAPAMDYLWWGIPKSPSVTLIAARAKAGKTIFAENLSLALVDENCHEFLGLNIAQIEKVAIISFEEHLHNRTQRQAKQLTAYQSQKTIDSEIDERIFVLDSNFYQFLADDVQRKELFIMVQNIKPEVLIIDSLGRLALGQIENSEFAQQVMLYLRELAFKLNIPIIVLHHTVKSKKSDTVELSSMAGSRIIAQEADAVFTIVDGFIAGEKIIKPLAFRYSGENNSDITFKINQHCLLDYITSSNSIGTVEFRESKEEALEKYFIQNCTATNKELEKYVKDNNLMVRSTLYEVLKKLPVENMGNGNYKYKYCNPTETFDDLDVEIQADLFNL